MKITFIVDTVANTVQNTVDITKSAAGSVVDKSSSLIGTTKGKIQTCKSKRCPNQTARSK